jgi:hypothetical protein
MRRSRPGRCGSGPAQRGWPARRGATAPAPRPARPDVGVAGGGRLGDAGGRPADRLHMGDVQAELLGEGGVAAILVAALAAGVAELASMGAPGRTRTCNLRIRSRLTTVHAVFQSAVLAAQVESAVQVMSSCRTGWSLGEMTNGMTTPPYRLPRVGRQRFRGRANRAHHEPPTPLDTRRRTDPPRLLQAAVNCRLAERLVG